MKNVRLVALLVALLMVAGLFAGCGTAKEEPTKQETSKEDTQKEEPKQEEAKKVEKVYAGLSIRQLNNPYYVQLVEGANMFIKSQPEGAIELQVLESGGSDEKQINDIKALIAKGGKNTIIYLDPNNAPNAAVVAEICEEAEVYWSTVWSMADGVYPTDYKYYVFHQSPDDQKSGYEIAVEMFKNFKTPNKGKILAIQGMLANSAAINRFKGLQKALGEYPDVKLLEDQAADWNPQKALSITETWLSKYKDIDGIWVANDSMALAVVEALKAKNLNGKVLVCGVDGIDDAVNAIKAGDMIATVGSNAWLQGSYGLAFPYAAYKGDIKTEELKPGQRIFHTNGILITKATVEDYVKNYIESKPKFDFNDLFSIIARPMEIEK